MPIGFRLLSSRWLSLTAPYPHCRSLTRSIGSIALLRSTVTLCANDLIGLNCLNPKQLKFVGCPSPIASSLTYRLRCTTSAVENAKNCWHENKCCHRGAQQTTDDSTPERGVLFAAVAQSESHRNHADDHSEGGHEHRSKAGDAGLDGHLQSI